jgi:hypothetical protein
VLVSVQLARDVLQVVGSLGVQLERVQRVSHDWWEDQARLSAILASKHHTLQLGGVCLVWSVVSVFVAVPFVYRCSVPSSALHTSWRSCSS